VEIELFEPLKGSTDITLSIELPAVQTFGRMMHIPGMPHFVRGQESGSLRANLLEVRLTLEV
jgi:hypothetical protein